MTHQEMAQIVIDDERADGTRSFVLYMMMSARTGLPPQEVKDRIYAMAKGNDDDPDTETPGCEDQRKED